MTYQELKELFQDHESNNPATHLTAYITFSSFGSYAGDDYDWKGRTYAISSNNKAFQLNMGGYSIFGCCLDGTDQGIRLERYMKEEHGGEDGWVVENTNLDQIYDKFGIDYNLLSLLMRKGVDKDGHLQIRWGEQKIA